MPDTPTNETRATLATIAALLAVVVILSLLAVTVVGWWQSQLPTPAPPPPREQCVATVSTGSASLELDQANFAAIIAGISVQRGLPPRAASIALATAMQESGLRNLNYGDRDSVGLFQQRPSQGWGTVEQIMDPQYSTGKFYDALVKVKNWQTDDINDVAQKVQRSGVPDGYRKHVDEARVLASALTGETTGAFTCLDRDPLAPAADSFAKLMSATYGGTVKVTQQPGPPAQVIISTADPRVAWSTAAAAQAWTGGYGVQSVTTAGQQWQISGTELASWTPLASPDPNAPTVVVTFSG